MARLERYMVHTRSVAYQFEMARNYRDCAKFQAADRNRLAAMCRTYTNRTKGLGRAVSMAYAAMKREVRHDAMAAQFHVLKGLALLRAGVRLT